MDNNLANSDTIKKFDYSLIKINHKLNCTPIKKLDSYINEMGNTQLSIIAFTFKKAFSLLINHHRISIYPDKVPLKEEECTLSPDEINLLKETLAFLPGKIVKAYICDVIYLSSRNNQFSLTAIECYLSHKSITEHNINESLFFYKMAMQLCNAKGDAFSNHKERIKKDLINITQDSKINAPYLEVYSILSIDKYLEKNTKIMFAELLSGVALQLIEQEKKIIQNNKTHSHSLLSLQHNIELYAGFASNIYKEAEHSNSVELLNAHIAKSLLSLVTAIASLEQKDITKQLMVQFCFLAEDYKNKSSRKALSEIGCNIHDVELLINSVKTNAVEEGETLSLPINNYIKEIELMIEKADSASDAFSLLGKYKFTDRYPLYHTDDDEKQNSTMEGLFKKITISDDGRTISHNQENNRYTTLFFGTYGAIFHAAIDMIDDKFSDSTVAIKAIVENADILPKKIKPFLSAGLDRWVKGDITSALFVLIPQYEFFVRSLLKHYSVSTITTNKGCQDELSLPNLMRKTETANIFSKEFIFEIEKLLTESSGTNFRHKVAHGLLTPDDLKNTISYYLCWRWLSIATGGFNPLSTDDK